MGSSWSGRARLGGLLWLVQLLTLPVEWIAIASFDAPYDLVDNTLSDLGAVRCGPVDYFGTAVEVCSPAHALFNASLFVGAVLVAVGAVLVRPVLMASRGAALATVGVTVLVLAQVGGAATALVPLDVDPELHLVVSTPAFVLQPVGLLLIGIAARRAHQRWAASMLVVGIGTLLVGCFFVVRLDPAGGGLLERLVLWPAALVLGLAGYALAHRRRPCETRR